jgi:cytochrome c peroxidase
MASSFATRALTRASPRAYQSAARAPLLRAVPRASLQAQAYRQQSRRGYSSEASSGGSSGGSGAWVWLLGAAAIGGGGYYAYSQGLFDGAGATAKPFVPKFEDYQGVYDAVAKKLADETDYDDGSYGPVLLRLAWHASGTSVLARSEGCNC